MESANIQVDMELGLEAGEMLVHESLVGLERAPTLIFRHPEQARLSANGVNCSFGMTSHFAGGMVTVAKNTMGSLKS